MKRATSVLLSLALAGTTFQAMAREGDSHRLAQCESALHQLFGENTRLQLKSLSHKRGGAFLRIKAMPVNSGSQTVTCQVDSEGQVISLTDRSGIALHAPRYDTTDKLSLND